MIILKPENNSVELEYLWSGLFTAREPWIHSRRNQDNYELIYVTNGTIYIRSNGVNYTLNKGDILLLERNTWHSGFRESPAGISFYWIHFLISDLSSFNIHGYNWSFSDSYRFLPLIKQFIHMANTPGYSQESKDMMMGVILSEIAASQQNHEEISLLVRECAEWISLNSDRPLTVGAVAAHFGYHPDYLTKIFKKCFGMSLKQYIISRHMDFIKSLLVTSNYSIKEIAAILGYKNENQFNHFFRYHEKLCPTQYRNLYIGTHMNRN